MSTENVEEPAVAVRCIRLMGQLVEAGTDDDGQPRMTIHTTVEQLSGLAALPLYIDAEISFSWPIEKISLSRAGSGG